MLTQSKVAELSLEEKLSLAIRELEDIKNKLAEEGKSKLFLFRMNELEKERLIGFEEQCRQMAEKEQKSYEFGESLRKAKGQAEKKQIYKLNLERNESERFTPCGYGEAAQKIYRYLNNEKSRNKGAEGSKLVLDFVQAYTKFWQAKESFSSQQRDQERHRLYIAGQAEKEAEALQEDARLDLEWEERFKLHCEQEEKEAERLEAARIEAARIEATEEKKKDLIFSKPVAVSKHKADESVKLRQRAGTM